MVNKGNTLDINWTAKENCHFCQRPHIKIQQIKIINILLKSVIGLTNHRPQNKQVIIFIMKKLTWASTRLLNQKSQNVTEWAFQLLNIGSAGGMDRTTPDVFSRASFQRCVKCVQTQEGHTHYWKVMIVTRGLWLDFLLWNWILRKNCEANSVTFCDFWFSNHVQVNFFFVMNVITCF